MSVSAEDLVKYWRICSSVEVYHLDCMVKTCIMNKNTTVQFSGEPVHVGSRYECYTTEISWWASYT